jgi:hypothetical protein
MFLDSVASQVFTAYIKGTSFYLTQSELENSDFKEKGTGIQPFFPKALQVQWLTTRLRFWDSQSSWEMVNALSDLYEGWFEWTVERNFAFVGDEDGWDLESLEGALKGKRENWKILPFPLPARLYGRPEHLTSNNIECALEKYICCSFNRLVQVLS